MTEQRGERWGSVSREERVIAQKLSTIMAVQNGAEFHFILYNLLLHCVEAWKWEATRHDDKRFEARPWRARDPPTMWVMTAANESTVRQVPTNTSNE